MMTRFLPRWPVLLDVRLQDFWLSFRETPPRPGRRHVRPYLVGLEDRVAPAAGALPLDRDVEDPGARIQIVMQIDDPNPKFRGVSEPKASFEQVSTNDEEAVDIRPLKAKVRDLQRTDDTDSTSETPASVVDNGSGARGRKNGGKKLGEGAELGMKDLKVLVRASARSFLVPLRVVPESAAANANGVPFVDRDLPPAATNPLPATASPRATEATGRPQLLTSPLDTGGVTPPTLTGPPTSSGPAPTAVPTAAPVTPAPVTLALKPARDVSLAPAVAAGVVLANFLPSALDLPRSGGDMQPTSDVGLRFTPSNTGIPVDGSAMSGRPAPLPTAGSGAGVVTEDLPDTTLPPIELVPPGSDQAPPVAAIETGVSGTAVFVATVAAVGLLAGAYYSQIRSQFRRTGRGPRLRVQ
jgi:hypothetical protein